MADAAGTPDFEAALRLFDETVRALEARARRLEEVLTVKQHELTEANKRLGDKVRELDSLSHYLELVLSSVASGVIAVNGAGHITTVNPAARRMCAGLNSALEGSPITDLFPDSTVPVVLAGDPGPLSGERHIPDPSRGARILEVVVSPIVDARGTVLGAVEVLDDVTDVRRLQEAVERGERLKSLGEMAAGVAHEIRNPLNGIEGFASLLARDLDPQSRSARHATAIVEGVRDLNRTVSGLLQFTNQRPPSLRLVPLAEVVLGVADLVRAEYGDDVDSGADDDAPRAPSAGDPLTVVIDDEWRERRIAIDGSQIRQVLLNLVQNAVQAQAEAGHCAVCLRVRSGQDPEHGRPMVFIEVGDRGPGIPDHLRQEIFTPFFTTKDHGTGLGLAIVHSIIAMHGGSLRVDDDPELGGARFSVVLPCDLSAGE